ncbi:response regulator transcription factor [Myroides odoratimimus]|uniref:response regulator transcription factor n=1 Tax=Myroides odoratimimus TaxID=76832 RepID=UPI003101971A
MTIRVGIIDDHKLFRMSFALLLSQFDDIEVVFDCSNGIELLEILKTTAIDLVFLDIQMPVMDGYQVVSKLNQSYPELCILILSSFYDLYSIERMLRYNISGYLTKDIDENQLQKAIYCVYDKGIYYDRQIRDTIALACNQRFYEDIIITDKELQIIKLFAKQYSGREIADILNCSLRTIEKQKEILMHKTNSVNFIGVIIFAMLYHYITEEDIIK